MYHETDIYENKNVWDTYIFCFYYATLMIQKNDIYPRSNQQVIFINIILIGGAVF